MTKASRSTKFPPRLGSYGRGSELFSSVGSAFRHFGFQILWSLITGHSSLVLLTPGAHGGPFFSSPEHVANLTPALWETADVGALWTDDFNRPALGTNWLILGGANVTVTNNELLFTETSTSYLRQMYYQPRLICSDSWTIHWVQRFAALNSTSTGVGVGIKNM
jgi:hypothetical protein